jgi:folate-dependent phosphoribosylglycinamide formyltransferase PurN
MLFENKKWVAMFSHTGNEIYNISKIIGRFPDRVITNKDPGDKDINKKLTNKTDVVYVKDRPDLEDYNRVLWDNSIITLHGWMRIVPKSVCKEHKMYNLHPGLITKYDELKGADPQRRVFECNNPDRYRFVGCVIHHVSPKVDCGNVIVERSVRNTFSGTATLTRYLHTMATELWVDFINLNLPENY